MRKLRRWKIKFTTGHSLDPRYIFVNDYEYKDAEKQLFRMYLSVNTTILSAKEVDRSRKEVKDGPSRILRKTE